LNEIGKEQAKALGKQLVKLQPKGFDAIYSSDLIRAYETAQIVREILLEEAGIDHSIITDSRLREIHFGFIEGMTYKEAMNAYFKEVTDWYDRLDSIPPPGGEETMLQVRERMGSFMKELDEKGYSSCLIVAHGGTIKSWCSLQENKPFWEMSIKHGQWIEYEVQGLGEGR
jgi:alpha-ribazole phosphatase